MVFALARFHVQPTTRLVERTWVLVVIWSLIIADERLQFAAEFFGKIVPMSFARVTVKQVLF